MLLFIYLSEYELFFKLYTLLLYTHTHIYIYIYIYIYHVSGKIYKNKTKQKDVAVVVVIVGVFIMVNTHFKPLWLLKTRRTRQRTPIQICTERKKWKGIDVTDNG